MNFNYDDFNFSYATRHAYDQLYNRYKISATKRDWAQAFLDITGGNAVLTHKNPQSKREQYIVKIQQVAVLVIYEPDSATIITALPPDYMMIRNKLKKKR